MRSKVRTLSLVDAASGRVLLRRVVSADSWWRRLVGLLGRKALEDGEGLLLPRCSSIHMFFMLFPIDVVYLDAGKRVRKIVARLRPWRISWCCGADSAVEAPAGWACEAGLKEGDCLVFKPFRADQQ